MTTTGGRTLARVHAFRPSILISETHNPYLDRAGVFAGALERIARDGFYRAAGIAGVPDGGERRHIASLVAATGLSLTYWTSFVLAGQGLNLSALDEELRTRSVSTLKQQLSHAAECGACALGVLSGPDPGPGQRPAALDALGSSLSELAWAAQDVGLRLVIEPLDRDVHKKGLLGPMTESVALLNRVAAAGPAAFLAWDCGHVLLNREEPASSLAVAQSFIADIHLSNPVLDAASPSYGDSHIPPGPPGLLTLDGLAQILRLLRDAGLLSRPDLGVVVEIRTPPGGDPWATEQMGREAMLAAVEIMDGATYPSQTHPASPHVLHIV